LFPWKAGSFRPVARAQPPASRATERSAPLPSAGQLEQAVAAASAAADDVPSALLVEALHLSEERFRLAVTASGLGISDHDLISGELHWSPELRAILGVDDDTPASIDAYLELVHPEDRAAALSRRDRSLRRDYTHGYRGTCRINRRCDGETRWLHTDGHPLRNDAGEIVRYIVMMKDVTDEKTAQDRINWVATHDPITGLPNRTPFQSGLEQALVDAARAGSEVGLLLIDLDNFKQINDTLGHQAGDQALTAFALRIGSLIPSSGLLARIGGDEFAAILPRANAAAAIHLANRISDALQRPIPLDERSVDLRASIGVGVYPHHGECSADLIQSADIALYAAKSAGRSVVRTFESTMRAELQRKLSSLNQARDAIAKDWIEPFYQPKIELATGRTVGFEALLRWRHPWAGIQTPDTIACAFDDPELAGLIGEAMTERVLTDLRRWLDQDAAVGRIAINASAAEFRNPRYAERLLDRLDAYGLPASLLELEITETAFLGDRVDKVLATLELLRGSGVLVALDDFGTGFSSLAHLRQFPVDVIKIDRSFVSGIEAGGEDRAIVEAVLYLGRTLGMTTVAEGIETPAQAEFVRAHNCTLGQGFLLGKPIPASEILVSNAA
jgi:diguanylate cyclase (GGDEF)-like protein/PAS domain S-box-containing protein